MCLAANCAFIDQRLSQNSDVGICHYVTTNELLGNPVALEGLTAYLKEERYQICIVDDEALKASRISWNILLQKNLNSKEENIFISDGDTFLAIENAMETQ